MTDKRVLVAGPSRPQAEALGAVIGTQQGLDVVGTASRGEDVTRLVAELGVDLVVIDHRLADEARTIRGAEEQTGPSIVLLTDELPLESVLETLQHEVHNGSGRSGLTGPRDDRSALTPREQSVLVLLGRALPPKQVAVELGISVHTCRGYVKSILNKLDSHSILEAVLTAQRRGLLPPDSSSSSDPPSSPSSPFSTQ